MMQKAFHHMKKKAKNCHISAMVSPTVTNLAWYSPAQPNQTTKFQFFKNARWRMAIILNI